MTETIQTLLLLLAVLVAVAVAAERLKTAPSILLVIVGVALALVPGLPRVELAAEFVPLVILPPLIDSAGVQMSWRELRFNLRPIALLAIARELDLEEQSIPCKRGGAGAALRGRTDKHQEDACFAP
jgi:CPA1 family monovalent cation:H+ antiporter